MVDPVRSSSRVLPGCSRCTLLSGLFCLLQRVVLKESAEAVEEGIENVDGQGEPEREVDEPQRSGLGPVLEVAPIRPGQRQARRTGEDGNRKSNGALRRHTSS